MAASVIHVDSILDEEAWNIATVIPLAYEYLPGDNIMPPMETEFLITFNEKFLYLAFRCYDPEPSEIRAHLMDRDTSGTLFQDDHVVATIDVLQTDRTFFLKLGYGWLL